MKNKQRVIYIRPCSYHVDFIYRPGSSQARKPFVHVNWWLFGSSTRVCGLTSWAWFEVFHRHFILDGTCPIYAGGQII